MRSPKFVGWEIVGGMGEAMRRPKFVGVSDLGGVSVCDCASEDAASPATWREGDHRPDTCRDNAGEHARERSGLERYSLCSSHDSSSGGRCTSKLRMSAIQTTSETTRQVAAPKRWKIKMATRRILEKM